MTAYPTWTPASRPGIIPLHPLGFGTVLGRSFTALRQNPRVLLGFALVVQVVAFLVLILGVGAVSFWSFSRLQTVPESSPDFATIRAGSVAIVIVTAFVLGLAAAALGVIVQGVVMTEVARGAVAERLELARLWAQVRPVAGRLIGYTFLLTLAMLLAIGAVTGIVFALSALAPVAAIVLTVLAVLAAIPVVLWLSTKLAGAAGDHHGARHDPRGDRPVVAPHPRPVLADPGHRRADPADLRRDGADRDAAVRSDRRSSHPVHRPHRRCGHQRDHQRHRHARAGRDHHAADPVRRDRRAGHGHLDPLHRLPHAPRGPRPRPARLRGTAGCRGPGPRGSVHAAHRPDDGPPPDARIRALWSRATVCNGAALWCGVPAVRCRIRADRSRAAAVCDARLRPVRGVRHRPVPAAGRSPDIRTPGIRTPGIRTRAHAVGGARREAGRAGDAVIRPLSDGIPPLTPDGDQARQWAEHELSDPAYAQARPTPVDRIARAVQDFLSSLVGGQAPDAWGLWLALAVAAILIALIIVSAILAGRSRLARRGSSAATELFGDTETRTAAQLRRAAASAVADEDWGQAVILRFRALARGLVERRAVELVPGATVHAFARAAGRAFPGRADDLDAAASAFDDVRYLRRPGTAALYGAVARADDAVQAERPVDAAAELVR
ncbi:DUF4129 domain-containing protein [Microbacterium elymi]|uniref:DUF4129 domain-containing protein n=1 Tax=Microbacterium elymi TaxID=2909587 RepID=A0ABY5NKL0_9MICO|nr:DUF4129 domain-containing protein [Microbacterium elymi]UUT35707.1 DUF4129 domain-containing protein [Microbacterium elymi]